MEWTHLFAEGNSFLWFHSSLFSTEESIRKDAFHYKLTSMNEACSLSRQITLVSCCHSIWHNHHLCHKQRLCEENSPQKRESSHGSLRLGIKYMEEATATNTLWNLKIWINKHSDWSLESHMALYYQRDYDLLLKSEIKVHTQNKIIIINNNP